MQNTALKVEFIYNPFGQRVIKKEIPTGSSSNPNAQKITYYTYDANGQVMAVYDITNGTSTKKATLKEQNIYGASRIGIIAQNKVLVDNSVTLPVEFLDPTVVQGQIVNGIKTNKIGQRRYEITNYLGNVNAVITDRRSYNASPTVNAPYEAVVINTADYYPFGMQMPDRHFSAENYRYAYNGMEVDPEMKGDGNSYTTEFRQYDPRIGRWLSLDPLMAKYPMMSPYVAFNNNPVFFTDPLGLEGGPAKEKMNIPEIKTTTVSTGQVVWDIFPKESYVDFAIENNNKQIKDDFYNWYFNKTMTIDIIVHHGNANINEDLKKLDGSYGKYDAGGKQGGHVMIHFQNGGIYGFTGAGVKDVNGDGQIDKQKEVPLFPTVNPEDKNNWYSSIHGSGHYGTYDEILKGNIKNGGLTTIFTINISKTQYYNLLSFYTSNYGKSPYVYSILGGERWVVL